MWYMEQEGTLPPPFNLLPTLKWLTFGARLVLYRFRTPKESTLALPPPGPHIAAYRHKCASTNPPARPIDGLLSHSLHFTYIDLKTLEIQDNDKYSVDHELSI